MFSKKTLGSIFVLAVLALGFLNVTGALGMGEPVSVIEKGAKYQSEDITVHVGQTIRLINKDPFFHQSQIRKLDEYGIEYPLVVSVLEPEGATVEVSLEKAGPYKLRCKIHDGMVLNINVVQ
jgi:plastocyanin